MDIVAVVIIIFAILLVILAVLLEKIESKIRINTEKLRIMGLKNELERLQSLPKEEVEWLSEQGFDVKQAIFECETGLLIRMDTIR